MDGGRNGSERSVLRRILVIGGWLVLAAGAACSKTSLPPEGWELADGGALYDVVGDSEPAAVLVIDPGACLQCTGILGEWLQLRHAGSGRFLVVYSRRATETERRILLTYSVPHDGTIVSGGPESAETPMEILFRSGHAVYRAYPVSPATSPLLRELRDRSLADVAASPPTQAMADPQPVSSIRR